VGASPVVLFCLIFFLKASTKLRGFIDRPNKFVGLFLPGLYFLLWFGWLGLFGWGKLVLS